MQQRALDQHPLEFLLETIAGAALKSFMAESMLGTYPLEAVASSHAGGGYAPAAGAFLVLSVELALDGVPWLGATPLFVRG